MKKVFAILMVVSMLFTSVAMADYTPSKNFSIRVPFAAGGSVDVMVRILAEGLQETFGNTAIVTNLTGANGTIAAADLFSVAPDATDMMAGGIGMFNLTPLFNPVLAMNIEDFQIVCGLVSDTNMLYVNPAVSGIESWEDLVEYAKTNRVIYGSNTPGGATHMLATVLFGQAGISAEAVTSDGSAKDLLALAGGNVVCAVANSTLGHQYVEEGTLKPILAISDVDFTGFEGMTVPSTASKGFDINFTTCNFLLTSKDAKPEEVQAIYEAILAYAETEAFKTQAANAHWTPDFADSATVLERINAATETCVSAFETYYK